MKYSFANVTQAVCVDKNIDKNIIELSTGCERGYECTISRPYMKEINQFSVDRDKMRIVVIANDTFSARQAYLCLINKFMRRSYNTITEGTHMSPATEEDAYSEIYDEQDSELAIEEKVTVITDNYFKEQYARAEKEASQLSMNLGKQGCMEHFKGTNLLFEICSNYDADDIIDGILKHDNRCIAIMLSLGTSYEYFIRRLSFEGGFDVIRVGRHSQADYVEYANRYLDYHGFQLAPNCDFNHVLEQLQAYRGALFTETDIYTLLAKGMDKAFARNQNIIKESDLALNWSFGNRSAMLFVEWVYVPSVSSCISSENCTVVVLHEVFHVYQYSLIEVVQELTPEQRGMKCFAEVDKWASNVFNYVSGDTKEELEEYFSQPFEWDAAEYAYDNISVYHSEIDKLLCEEEMN